MSGGREFSEARLRALADHVFDRSPMPSVKLSIVLWLSDFEAYRDFGKSLTGATWCVGTWEDPVFVREVGEDWFRRYVRERVGPIPVLLGWLFALWAAVRYAR